MPLLVRRINRVKWEQIVNTDIENDVSADAITNCLKTFNNDLSVWHIESDADIEKAILALITGSRQASLSTFDIVVIDEKLALNSGLSLADTKGDTVVKELVDTHKDLTKLTYSKLGVVKDLILDCIKDGKSTRRYTKSQLKKIINQAISDNKIAKDDLPIELVSSERL